MTSESGFVWSMNCESWDEPKNSLITAVTGLALIRSCGMSVSISCRLMRSLMARSMRTRPMRYWFSSSSPTARTRRLPRWSMSSMSRSFEPFFRSMRKRTTSRTSRLVRTWLSSGSSSPNL